MIGRGLLILAMLACAQPAVAQTRLDLRGRFDPVRLELEVRGETSFSAMENDCTGYVSREPQVILDYTPGDTPPRAIEIRLESETDTVLALLLPGEPLDVPAGHPRYCSDDEGGGVNPAMRVTEVTAGQYRLYPGLYARGETARAVLTVRPVD